MERPRWKNWQLLQVLPSLTPTDILNHLLSTFDSTTILCFVNGNANKTQVNCFIDVLLI